MNVFQPGEIVDITITGARVHRVATEGHDADVTPILDLTITEADGRQYYLQLPADWPSVTVERADPEWWPPRPGDLLRYFGVRLQVRVPRPRAGSAPGLPDPHGRRCVMTAHDRAAYVAGLRELADLIESTPDLPVPTTGRLGPYIPVGDDDAARAEVDRIAEVLPLLAGGGPMSLTETERQAMVTLDAEVPADRLTRRGGLLLADKLRVAVPGADDVTLARVALELMRELTAARDSADVKAASSGLPRNTVRGIALGIAVQQFGGAVLNLTSLDWKDIPS